MDAAPARGRVPRVSIAAVPARLAEHPSPGATPALRGRVLPALAIVLVAMAIGEASGYALGVGEAIAKMEDYELHRRRHLSRRDRLAADRPAPPDTTPAAAPASA